MAEDEYEHDYGPPRWIARTKRVSRHVEECQRCGIRRHQWFNAAGEVIKEIFGEAREDFVPPEPDVDLVLDERTKWMITVGAQALGMSEQEFVFKAVGEYAIRHAAIRRTGVQPSSPTEPPRTPEDDSTPWAAP